VLNQLIYTIRTETEILATPRGLANALQVLNDLGPTTGVAVFFGDSSLNARFFRVWGQRLDDLINRGIGWNGQPIDAR
jgi:hypothetical protein